jgi:hypothetical protein
MRAMPPRGHRSLSRVAAACAAAAVLGAATAEAQGRMVMLYDTADHVRQIATGPGALDQEVYNLFQQQPVARVLAPSRQAWKVSGRGPSRATPGLRGRSVNSMVSLLRDRIARSGGRLVFIDEAGLALHSNPQDVTNLAAALEILSLQTLPQTGSQPLNERVHVYVQGVPAPLVRPDRWEATWRVLALAGGVWWQAYTSNRSWNEAEWATWANLIQRNLNERGGDLSRLRWVFRHDPRVPVADQFAKALRAPACWPLANGVGVWRIGPESVPFREGWRAIADGLAPCVPSPSPEHAQAVALDRVTGLEAGAALGDGMFTLGAHGAERLPAGAVPNRVPVRVRLDLGPDPLGIAAGLGVDPATFWPAAGATIRAAGAGVNARWALVPGRPLDVYLLPERRGVINLTLKLPVRGVREALGGPGVDLLAALESVGGPRNRALERRLIQNPAGAALMIPLRDRRGANLLRVENDRGALPSRAQVLLPARLAGNRIAPRHLRPVAVRLRDGRGLPVARVRTNVRLPGGRVLSARSNAAGVVRLAIPRRAGAHVVSVPGTRIRIVRRLGAPSPTARPAPRRAPARGPGR